MSQWKKVIVKLALVSALSTLTLGSTMAAQAEIAPKALSPSVLTVKAGVKTLVVRLKSNRTTGYSWFLLNYDANFLKPISYHYDTSKTGMMGASGISVWTFEVLPAARAVPGMTTLTWTYARPWETPDHAVTHKTAVYFVGQ